jgi:glycosyltransferase involved in cell wall biosynthesis
MTRIVGIFLVRNEDIFIERAVRNVLDFCDRVLIADNQSTDGTWDIVRTLALETSKIECRRIRRTGDSHEMIRDYAGTMTWVFGVDGDEIYDPVGLARFRERLVNGDFDRWWAIFGNVLNCTGLDHDAGVARGHLAPPCRSMTKLYNFNAITRWDGECIERLHGGMPEFRPNYGPEVRFDLYKEAAWGESDFRCLHTCFLRRSSREPAGGKERVNIMELAARGRLERWSFGLAGRKGRAVREGWKREKYMRGDLVTADVSSFFPGVRNVGAAA